MPEMIRREAGPRPAGRRPARLISVLVAMIVRNPRMLMARPAVSAALLGYLRKFKPRRVDGQIFIHSHLPAVNSKAYSRFIEEHLLGKCPGPSHAQVAVTNACPQRCAYCYNRHRRGQPMDLPTLRKTIAELKAMGVFWLGWTGGEPLLRPDLVALTEEAAPGCTVKLFTTGLGLTAPLARDLRAAGLSSVSVSLDHWTADVHDRVRGYPGAFQAAMNAIGLFQSAGLHVGVSAVLTREMIRNGEAETFLDFLRRLGLDEAWLSEAKPTLQAFWKPECIVSDSERRTLIEMQDRANRKRGMTVNYLGHFEDAAHFGCNAGGKMIYVDAFGEVSPCVFAPMTFGNVQTESLGKIAAEMRASFAPDSACFVNANYPLFAKHYAGRIPLSPLESRSLMGDVRFGRPGRYRHLIEGSQ